ncbi:UDP-N-acetylmuramate dehydrogenase [Aquipuribacter nitratireducens]|uniref:UDP-N-acetylenolpyruvoylglucosamine reductase n=1 Tax=Aquipuribacter nitratireducens TaxID=650104 RepID=A0ABW0GL41_9MICO
MPTTLADLTTLRVGGPAGRLVTAGSPDELLAAVQDVDARGDRLLLVAGGSNLVVSDEGFPGTVVHVRPPAADAASGDLPGRADRAHPLAGVTVPDVGYCGGADVLVEAGVVWDDLVALAVAKGWSGLEALSGIPGSVGATPVQNVGAYGAEVADTVASVQVWDRVEQRTRTLFNRDCAFSYRDSLLKRAAREGPDGGDRYVVLRVRFQLPVADLSAPVRYAELARRLGVGVGERAPLGAVREAVLALRAGKGMVLDRPEAPDPDTWSVGSFFTNPVVPAAALPGSLDGAPRWPAGTGEDGAELVKLPAAWLIEHAGIAKGHGLPGPAAVSTKHTLALTNRGGARAADVVDLAREVRDAVRQAFGVVLVPEPRLVGVSL